MARRSKSPDSISLIDVANHAGVSRATASLVLRESPLVARATRERVHRAVEELGYIYNRGAANLRAQRTKTIGLLVSNISNPFFSELTIGVDATLDAAGYVAFLANTGESLAKVGFLARRRGCRRRRPAPVTGPPGVRQLERWKMPWQTLGFISALQTTSVRTTIGPRPWSRNI